MEPTVAIAAYNTKLEAELVLAKLREAGIEGFIDADNLGGTFPMMQMTTGGYKVMVPETQADEAAEIAGADAALEVNSESPPQSAVSRVLMRRSPTQVISMLALMIATLVTILYAVTQGTL